jgi:hypothetical protein
LHGDARGYGCPVKFRQALPSVYLRGRILGRRWNYPGKGRAIMVVGIAIAIFIALFGWGATYFGWSDPDGKVQLALATAFILGIIGGYKVKN